MSHHYPIAVGDRYSYKKLCEILGVKETSGDAKKNQEEHWKTCFEWIKLNRKDEEAPRGHQYKITKLIKPLYKRPHKQRENSKWYKNAAIILLNNIAYTTTDNEYDSDGYNELLFTSIEGYITLGLCNGKFRNLKSKDFTNIPIEHRIKFNTIATNKFYHILTNVLESLKTQSIISYYKTYRLSKEGEDKKLRLATSEEYTAIICIMNELLVKHNLKNEHDAVRNHKADVFYAEFNQLLEEEGFYYCFKVYRISFTESCLPRLNEYIDGLDDPTSAKKDINEKSYKDLLKKIEDEDIGYVVDNDGDYNDRHEYIENFRKLIELTIPI